MEADLHRLEFIRHAKALGLTLEQIRELVVTARQRTCSMTRPLLLRVLRERILQTTRQIEALRRLEAELTQRLRTLTRRPPTDHGRGYCACFEDGTQLIPVSEIRPSRVRVDGDSGRNGRRERTRKNGASLNV